MARAVPGDEIVLDAGGIYIEAITLGDKGPGLPITIRSSAALPDRRISPADRALLPIIASGSSMAPITIRGSQWHLVGLAFRANTLGEGNIIDVQGAAANIVIDRVLIEGGVHGQKRGVAMNGGGAITVTRSHIANMWKIGQDSQALAGWDGPGPFTIRDNFLEAASENILFGGADSSSESRMPADILVEGNHLSKNLAWKGASGYAVKNLFELKAARRATIRNNLMERNWPDGQSGWAVVVTPRNQDGGAPWTVIEDVRFEGNIVRDTSGGINITGKDDVHPSGQTTRVTFAHNLFVTESAWLQAGGEIGVLTLNHNTVVNGSTLMKLYIGTVREAGIPRPAAYAIAEFVVLNSLMHHGKDGYGIWGEASGIGIAALEFHTLAFDMRRNVVAGENGWGLAYPADTQQPAYAEHAAHFGTDFRLAGASSYRGGATDGTDLGWVVAAATAAPPPPPPPPSDPAPASSSPVPPPPPTALPSPWTSQDVGYVGLAGGATLASGTFTIRGAGTDVWGTEDAMHFVWQRVTGDVDIIARVSAIENLHPWTKAGVMVRENTGANAAHAFMLVSPGKGLAFQRRVASGGLSAHTSGGAGTSPAWVKLERRGNTVTAFRSDDGVSWVTVGADTFAMGSDVTVGLAVSSHYNGVPATATFDGVHVRRVPRLPDGWTSQDVGTVGAAGSANGADGAFTITGAGADIWGTVDGLHYVWQRISGDVDVVARVASVDYINGWTKAGVMIRHGVAADAAHALMLVSPGKGLAFQRRRAAGAISTHTTGGAGTAPSWVKLSRRGNTITAFRSPDGQAWTLVGSDTFSMPREVMVGLAVSSHDSTFAATATFEGVSVSSPWTSQDVGDVALAGDTVESDGAVTLRASGADVWGTADAMHYRWQQIRGDVDVIARVSAVEYAHAWTKAGVMIRESLTADSAHAFMLVSAGKGLAFQRRAVGGGLSTHTAGSAGTAPSWVKLERRGAVITAFESADGVTWTLVGSETFSMTADVHVGLAVTSHQPLALGAARFEAVTIVQQN